jgi:hypothetical protein
MVLSASGSGFHHVVAGCAVDVYVEKGRGQRSAGKIENLIPASPLAARRKHGSSIETMRPSSIRITGRSCRLVPFQSFFSGQHRAHEKSLLHPRRNPPSSARLIFPLLMGRCAVRCREPECLQNA